jgi:signal transduction histidine kinase
VAVIVALMTITTLIDIDSRRTALRESMLQTGQDFATIANGVLPDAVRSRDLNATGQFATALWGQRDTSYVKIFDQDGLQLVGPGEGQFPRGVRDPGVLKQVADLRTVLRWTNDGLEVIAPVTSGAQLVGAVQFGFDRARIDDEINALTKNRIEQTGLFIVLGIIGSYMLTEYFLRPIRTLVAATVRIARGDLTTRVRPLRGREMQNLGSSFNSMAVELEEMVNALHDSRSRIVTTEDRVRKEIASHLHGPVQGRLLALRAQIDEVNRLDTMPPNAVNSLSAIIDEMGRVIQSDIAVLSRRLYPAIVRRGLVPAMQSLTDEFDATLDVELKLVGAPADLGKSDGAAGEQTRLAAYRIANEALTNAVKYAARSKVQVIVDQSLEGWLSVTISDDGPGFAQDRTSEGLGLAAMRDYAEAAGGTCTLTSAPGRGTSVVARLPLRQEQPA